MSVRSDCIRPISIGTYVSIRQHTPAYVRIRMRVRSDCIRPISISTFSKLVLLSFSTLGT
jgi:hypothetical protein